MGESERGHLSRQRITLAAIGIIDDQGLDGLSMRRLGAALGVEAMSLYHYVASKNDLLDSVMVQLYSEIEIPEIDDAADWQDAVRSGMRSFYKVLVDHPAALTLFATRPADSPEAFLAL
ncbi:MAG: AcrR family transcriptional regulator [Acidimicrobiales bacterium]|jgi:AcrR family transcriptional regulator